MKKQGFTLAEVLITLAIIGVVAAISIPSVVANTQQKEFQTGLRKAVSVLNSAITMNMALDGESPYENKNLYEYLQRHMSVMRSSVATQSIKSKSCENCHNIAFYTTDGMRFEMRNSSNGARLHENHDIELRGGFNGSSWNWDNEGKIIAVSSVGTLKTAGMCGSYGLNGNTDNTVNPPCLVIVDVNGDRKPFPKNAACYRGSCYTENIMKFADPDGIKLTDIFPIMITDKQAIPYGTAAQKAMYQAQSKNK